MRILAVDAFPLRARMSRQTAASVRVGLWTHRTCLLVRVRTDEGIEGWGETDGPLSVLRAGIDDVLAPAVVGRDPRAVEAVREAMLRAARRLRPGLARAVSAVEMALWDIMGKTLDEPVWRLWGADPGARFPAVATGVFYAADAPADVGPRIVDAETYVAEGHRAVKLKIGGLSPSGDVAHVHAIREAVGDDVMIAVDANCAYTVGTALEVAGGLEDAGVYWYEEPLGPEQTAGYAAIAQATRLRLAGGQALTAADAFVPLLEEHALHIVQPGTSVIGGMAQARDTAAMARAMGAAYVAPAWGTGVLAAACLPVRAVTRSPVALPFPDGDWIERDVTDNPLRAVVPNAPSLGDDGCVGLPDGPGLGVVVDTDAVSHFAA